VAGKFLKAVVTQMADEKKGDKALTERISFVLRLVSSRASNYKIADKLSIPVNTNKSHLKNILSKLHLENRKQAATYAMRHVLVTSMD
jgi:DNA-binding NarL/FixJ family response regulator